MALKDLERLTSELEELTCLLEQESKTEARWVIFRRVQEIISMIGEGFNGVAHG